MMQLSQGWPQGSVCFTMGRLQLATTCGPPVTSPHFCFHVPTFKPAELFITEITVSWHSSVLPFKHSEKLRIITRGWHEKLLHYQTKFNASTQSNNDLSFATSATSTLKLSAPSAFFLFSPHVGPIVTTPGLHYLTPTLIPSQICQIFTPSYTHCTHSSFALTHTHCAVYTSLPSASSTSPRWSPVCASTWRVSGPTGRSQFPLTGNTGGSTWTALSHSSCWTVRWNTCVLLCHIVLHLTNVTYSNLFYLAINLE